jgi:hypothetical protein
MRNGDNWYNILVCILATNYSSFLRRLYSRCSQRRPKISRTIASINQISGRSIKSIFLPQVNKKSVQAPPNPDRNKSRAVVNMVMEFRILK